jgi:uncharacterized protein DUF6352
MNDFWLSCGHHLVDRDRQGRLCLTDELMRLYLARPELAAPEGAGVVERTLRDALLSDPWRPLAAAEVDAIADADARENWQYMIRLRDQLAAHRTIEATYMALVQKSVQLPPMFFDQLAQLILRNALDLCDDAHELRAAELFFRRQRLTIHDGALLAADQEYVDSRRGVVSPLVSMLGLQEHGDIDVLSEANASAYWERSDRFDMALDLTAGRRGLVALGSVIVRWVKHLLGIDIVVEPVTEPQQVELAWYVGLEPNGTKIGDALWNGLEIDDATRSRVVALFRLTFRDPAIVIERVADQAVHLILAMTPDGLLRIKPQNLLTGLPVRHLESTA